MGNPNDDYHDREGLNWVLSGIFLFMVIAGAVAMIGLVNRLSEDRNTVKATVPNVQEIQTLEQKVQEQEKRVGRIVEYRKEAEQLVKNNEYYLPWYIQMKQEEEFQKKLLERLKRKQKKINEILDRLSKIESLKSRFRFSSIVMETWREKLMTSPFFLAQRIIFCYP